MFVEVFLKFAKPSLSRFLELAMLKCNRATYLANKCLNCLMQKMFCFMSGRLRHSLLYVQLILRNNFDFGTFVLIPTDFDVNSINFINLVLFCFLIFANILTMYSFCSYFLSFWCLAYWWIFFSNDTLNTDAFLRRPIWDRSWSWSLLHFAMCECARAGSWHWITSLSHGVLWNSKCKNLGYIHIYTHISDYLY